MCTLIIGFQVLGPGSVLLGANRDEDPRRPSDPPAGLNQSPWVVGGRDRLAGGTWLAVRGRRAAVAILNRRDPTTSAATKTPARRSRGLITLEVARAGDTALARALEIIEGGDFAPFSLAFLAPEACWVVTHEPGTKARVSPIPAGWHVLTHADVDDPSEPRTARLLGELADWKPGSVDEAERGLIVRLSEHGAPTVCIHEGPMVTVSSSIVALGPGLGYYRHCEGRPCEQSWVDVTPLLEGPTRVEA